MRRSSSVDDLGLLTEQTEEGLGNSGRLDMAFVQEICFDHVAGNANGCEVVQFIISDDWSALLLPAATERRTMCILLRPELAECVNRWGPMGRGLWVDLALPAARDSQTNTWRFICVHGPGAWHDGDASLRCSWNQTNC